MRKGFIVLGAVLLALIMAGISGEEPVNGEQAERQAQLAESAEVSLSSSMKVDIDFGRMPLYFIPNKGQMDKQVSYYVQGKDKTIYFTENGITLALGRAAEKEGESSFPGRAKLMLNAREEELKGQNAASQAGTENGSERWVVKLDFVGANPDVKPFGQDETGAIISYFKGNKEDWRSGLPTYSKIIYPNLWPGIDLVYYGTVNNLKYEFIVHPGADPSKIRLAYRGAEKVSVDGDGRLQVMTPLVGFRDDVPAAYQEVRGEKVGVSLAYKLEIEAGKNEKGNFNRLLDKSPGDSREAGTHVYGFEVGEYDPAQILILDPAILAYCGYIGGPDQDIGNGIAVDSSGNAYITGYTQSTTAFPEIVGPDLTYNGGAYDAFVAKISAAGGSLVYCGYVGGSSSEIGYGIAVDSSGNAYVTGWTSSDQTTFPVTVGPDLIFNGGTNDAFVAKVNAAGTALVYCGYIGGSGADKGTGIALDGSGNAYVTGTVASTQATFPVIVGPDLTHNGGGDAYVAKVNASGTGLVFCGYIGGSSTDDASKIAVDGLGNVYVTGYTNTTEATFPVAVGPDLTYNGGTLDAFVAKVSNTGGSIIYCGYIGGNGTDNCNGIAVDSTGNAYLIGYTYSDPATFPSVVGPDLTYNGGSTDAFVAKVNASGAGFDYCGFIGGIYSEQGLGIALDGSGSAYVIGYTNTTEATFPVAVGPDLTFNGGVIDVFVAKVNPSGTGLIYCGYIGGSGNEYSYGIAVDGSGNAYVIGCTDSAEATFPVAVGPDLTYNGGSYDAFVAKVYYFEQPVHKHAAGDFDGDGTDEAVIDFGPSGIWMWNGGAWSQLSTNNPENMIPFDIDGNGDAELAADLGSLGLWMWNGGVWGQLSVNNPEYMIAADTNNNGIDELIIDFGAAGLGWRQEGGMWYGMTGYDPQNILAMDVDDNGDHEVVADFGTMGMWLWTRVGSTWNQLTAADPNTMAGVDAFGFGNKGMAAGLGGLGTWLWDSGMWGQLSGVGSDRLISGKMMLGGGEEIAGDFGLLGLWLWGSSTWTQLSGVNADDMMAADTDGNGIDEVAGDFALLGLWLWDSGSWSQLSGVNPEGLLAGDIDGDTAMELIVDFGSLGVWLWNGGTWSQVSALNPD